MRAGRKTHTRQGHVDGVALSIPRPHICHLASARVDVLLVRADEEDGGVAVEEVVGAIAVVHIIIKHHDLHVHSCASAATASLSQWRRSEPRHDTQIQSCIWQVLSRATMSSSGRKACQLSSTRPGNKFAICLASFGLTGALPAQRTFCRPCRCWAWRVATATVPNKQKPMGPFTTAWCPGGRQTPKPTAAGPSLSEVLATTASTSAVAAPAACVDDHMHMHE